MTMKIKNRRKARNNFDPSSVDSNSYSDSAGGRKITDVGHHLRPFLLDAAANTYTTDASTKRKVGKGVTLAFYNSNAAAQTITLGAYATVVTLAVGVTNTDGNVGIPVGIGEWIYLNTYTYDGAITSHADVKMFIVEDDTFIDNR